MDGLQPFFEPEPTSSGNNEQLLEFGGEEGSEDEIEKKSIPDEDVYDAVNDETFGADVSAILDDDLAQFSTRVFSLD